MTTRRNFLMTTALTTAAARLRALAAAPAFNYSICNEVFEKRPFAEQCKMARKMGYTGLEIAPFTLADDVADISASRRRELRDTMKSEGLRFAGLHWLLVTPKWLHITTGDKGLRDRSWKYFEKLVDLAGDLGQPSIMVLGSPKQRGTTPGVSREQAAKYLAEMLARVGPRAAQRKTTVCLEALDHNQTDVVNTLAESVAIVKQVNHPAIQTMFDYHNVADEKEASDVLVRRFYPMIRHIHINEMDGRHPGTGKMDFLPVMRVLKEKNYRGWVSLEVFDFKAGAETIGTEAMAYMRKLEGQLSAVGPKGRSS